MSKCECYIPSKIFWYIFYDIKELEFGQKGADFSF